MATRRTHRLVNAVVGLGWAIVAGVILSGTVAAHAGTLRLSSEPATVPEWLLLSTGGGVVFGSFLLTAMVTDRAFLRWYGNRTLSLSLPASRPLLARLVQSLSVVGLGCVLVVGAVGPQSSLSNPTILFVWVGWWAGYTISVYTLGNSWPLFNPWRTLVGWLPSDRDHRVPGVRFSRWTAVGGLLGLVYLEVVTPVATDPRLLSAVIGLYTLVTLCGGWYYGEQWFERVDPIARVFQAYGAVGVFGRRSGRLVLRSPASGLVRSGDVPFVIAILWATTYDGLTGTPLWATTVRSLVADSGPVALSVYALALVVGYLCFLGAYHWAVRWTRRTGPTYVDPAVIAERFVPSLLAIAAGYHLAHYLGYVIELLPVLLVALAQPFGGPLTPVRLVAGPWLGTLQLLFVVAGHVVAVWVAHTSAFELFTGTLQPLRIQYPLVIAMMAYTVVSLWIVLQPYAVPPFVA